jgi:hypothetical protein
MYSQNLLKHMGIRLATEFTKTAHGRGDERLWKAVVATAFEDCLNLSGSKIESYRKEDAHKWFMSKSEDFHNVCYMASLEPLLVYNRYLYLLKNKKVKFTEVQNYWIKYRNAYKVYRETRLKEQRKIIRSHIEKIKCKILKFKPKKK